MAQRDRIEDTEPPATDPGEGGLLHAKPEFADDDGAPDLGIRSARDNQEVVHAIRRGRLLIGVVPTPATVGGGADMAVAKMITHDGRSGLLGFSGIDALYAWDPSARPVPVAGSTAALSALHDECEALVVDVRGPRTWVIVESDLVSIASLSASDYAATLIRHFLERRFGARDVETKSLEQIGRAHV